MRYVCVVLPGSQNNDWFKLLFQICCHSAENGKNAGTCSSLDWATVSPPLSLSLSGTQLALHMSSGWRLTGFAGHSKKLQRGCIGGFLKAVVIVPKQLGPAHRSFHLES